MEGLREYGRAMSRLRGRWNRPCRRGRSKREESISKHPREIRPDRSVKAPVSSLFLRLPRQQSKRLKKITRGVVCLRCKRYIKTDGQERITASQRRSSTLNTTTATRRSGSPSPTMSVCSSLPPSCSSHCRSDQPRASGTDDRRGRQHLPPPTARVRERRHGRRGA